MAGPRRCAVRRDRIQQEQLLPLVRSVGQFRPNWAKDVLGTPLTDSTRTAIPWNCARTNCAHLTANAATVEPPAEPPAGACEPEGPNDGPNNPHRLAMGYLATLPPCDLPPAPNAGECWRPALRFWRGEFHGYCAGAYRAVPDDDIRGEVTEYVRAEFVRLNAEEMAAWRNADGKNKGQPPQVRPVTSRLVGDVLQALRGLCLLPAAVDAPSWIDGATGPDPAELLPFTNGILDFGALAAKRAGCLLPPSLSYFTPTAAPFDFDPDAPEPREWVKFLREVWLDDQESLDTLQEWFGLPAHAGHLAARRFCSSPGPLPGAEGASMRGYSANWSKSAPNGRPDTRKPRHPLRAVAALGKVGSRSI